MRSFVAADADVPQAAHGHGVLPESWRAILPTLRSSLRRGRGPAHSYSNTAVILVAIFGILATLVGVQYARKAPGVFYSRVQVRFLAPKSLLNPNTLKLNPKSVVITAAVVAHIVDPRPKNPLNDETLTIVDEGIRDGWSVSIPQSGGQFLPTYAEPWLNVEASGPTPEQVTATVKSLTAKVIATLEQLQASHGVASANRITTNLIPAGEPQVAYLHGSRTRATLSALILGIGLTVAAARTVAAIRRRHWGLGMRSAH